MNGKCTNHVLLAALGILVLLLNTSPTLAYSDGMTKQDFVNFINGRTINFNAMYHGGWTDKTPNIWITPGTYSIAYMHINSAGKLWYVGISSNIITYGDDSSNILTDTIPNDVFTAATNALAPYLITTYITPKPTPTPYITPAPTPTPYITPKPTQQKTKQDFVNFIGGRTINFNAMYHGGWTDKTPNIWITPGTYSIAYMHINSAGKLWYVGISSNIITYGDDSSNILTDTIPNDVFTAATNALAPYLITTYITPKPTPTPYITPAPTPTPYITPAPTPTPYITPAPTPTPYITPKPTPTPYITPKPTQQKTKQDFVNFIGGRIPDYQALPQGYSTASEPNIWKSSISFSESVYIYSGDGSLWRVSIRCNDPSTTRCIWYDDMQAQQTVMTIPSDVFTIATNGIAPFLKNRPPI